MNHVRSGLVALVLILLAFCLYDLDKNVILKFGTLADRSVTAVDQVNQAATDERAFLKTESTEFLKTTAALKQILVSTDANLNRQGSGLLPKLNAAVDQQNAAFLELQRQAGASLQAATTTIEKLPPIAQNLTDATAEIATDVHTSLPEAMAAIHNVDVTTANAAAVSKDAKDVSDHYTQIILHPVHTVWTKIYRVWQIAVGSAEITTAVK